LHIFLRSFVSVHGTLRHKPLFSFFLVLFLSTALGWRSDRVGAPRFGGATLPLPSPPPPSPILPVLHFPPYEPFASCPNGCRQWGLSVRFLVGRQMIVILFFPLNVKFFTPRTVRSFCFLFFFYFVGISTSAFGKFCFQRPFFSSLLAVMYSLNRIMLHPFPPLLCSNGGKLFSRPLSYFFWLCHLILKCRIPP